jgi:NAD(P)H-hydrate epimerase
MNPPVLTRQQVREVDRLAVEAYGMSSLVLMENAGRGCVDVLEKLQIRGPVVVCCGRGNNGGDGFVIARHLDIRRYPVQVVLCCDPAGLSGDAAANYHILARSDVEIVPFGAFERDTLEESLLGADWIVDALLGTGAQGEPRSPYREVIETLNAWPARKLAVDLSSGLDCDTGRPATATFRAEHTCTFVAAKPGFLVEEARPFVGELHVLDIGAPRKLMESLNGAVTVLGEKNGQTP